MFDIGDRSLVSVLKFDVRALQGPGAYVKVTVYVCVYVCRGTVWSHQCCAFARGTVDGVLW